MTTTTRQITDKANELGYGWAVSDVGDETYDTAREYARAILYRVDHSQAPTSETALLTDANVESARCADADLVDTLDWFLRAYTVQDQMADADNEFQSEVYEWLFTGNLEAAESMVAARVAA